MVNCTLFLSVWEVNSNPTPPFLVHMMVTLSTTYSKNTELAVELILLLFYIHVSLLCKHDSLHEK
jgi:hypothetical protein